VAYLKVTSRCNLDCPYCPWHTGPSDFDGEIGTDEWKLIIDDLAKRGVRIFAFEGGEPTLRRDLQVLLDHARSRGGYTILATNATTRMPLYRPSAFSVSIDGPRDIHDRVRGAGTYDRMRANLVSRTGNQPVLVITVISRENQMHLEQMVEEVSPIVNGFLFTFVYPYGANRTETLTDEEIESAKATLLRLKKHGFRVLNPRKQLKRKPGEWKCHDALTASVDHRGRIRSGCFVDHVEPHDCLKCHLGCYQLLSALHDFNFEAWFNIHRFVLKAI
jgi:MoaA/NifB/PqqE/SkfB family radical SAM enzyme